MGSSCGGCCEPHEKPNFNMSVNVNPNQTSQVPDLARTVSNTKTGKSKMRVSFSDTNNAGPICESMNEVGVEEVVEKGVVNVHFGILRQSNLYGCSQALPDGATGADIVQPVPAGVTAEVRNNGLWITFESNEPGRCQNTFMAKLAGNVDPIDLTINVFANVMSIDEGRPSSKREGVQLLQRRTPARFSILDTEVPMNEGMMWNKGKALNQDEVAED